MREALWHFLKDDSLVVLKSDKENVSVVMDRPDYSVKIMATLGDKSF